MSINSGLSTIGGLVLDADGEDADFATQNYGGAKDILLHLLDRLVAVSDMPKSKLLGSSNSSAFSEGGLSDRYEWASCVERFQVNHWEEPLTILSDYLFRAKKAFNLGEFDYAIEFPSILQLTHKEEAELRKLYAESYRIHLDGGILLPDEVRNSLFGGSSYNIDITLDKKLWREHKAQQEKSRQQSVEERLAPTKEKESN